MNRYIAGLILRVVRGRAWDEADETLEPTVTIIVPMFNEGEAIEETLRSLVALSYPRSKLEILCVDDASTDDSLAHAQRVARESFGRVRVIENASNIGKRMSILHATRIATGEIIVTVDSDVVVEPDAIRQIVRRFTDERIAAVGGWVDVRNKHDNWLTRMQTVKYWYSYFLIKNIEWGFRRVMCLSGCLTAYRRRVLLEIEPALLRRTVIGVPITYGEDRYLTRQLIKAGYLTTMTLAARCKTTVPATLSQYFSQQLRWRRSAIVDYGAGLGHVWKLNPLLAIHFTTVFTLLFVYPIGVVTALVRLNLIPALVFHIKIMLLFGIYYRWRVRNQPAAERVGILAVLPLAVLMPLSYAIHTPLALFTLDTGRWETRNHVESSTSATEAVNANLASGSTQRTAKRAIRR